MKIVALSFKIGSAARPPVRGHPSSARPLVRPSTRAGAGRTYIPKSSDRPPWADRLWQKISLAKGLSTLCKFGSTALRILSFKIGPAARPPVRPPSARRPPVRPPPVRPSVHPSARSGAGRTYIHKTPDRPLGGCYSFTMSPFRMDGTF